MFRGGFFGQSVYVPSNQCTELFELRTIHIRASEPARLRAHPLEHLAVVL